MTVLSLTRVRSDADPSRHNSARMAAHHRDCPDSPTGAHIRRRGELRCMVCRCRLPLHANAHKPFAVVPALLPGDSFMSRAALPTTVNVVRLAISQAEKMLDASMEGSPAEDRYRRLAGHLEAALEEIAHVEVGQ